MTAKLDSHSGVPNLLGLPAPVYAGTVLAGALSTAPMAAAHARGAPAARVDKSGSGTTLRDQRLANYEARLRQESSVPLVLNTMAGTRVSRGTVHGQVVQTGADGTWKDLAIPGHATKNAGTSCLLMLSSCL